MASRLDTAVTGGAPNLLGSLTAAARPLPEDADWQAYGISHTPENCGIAWPWQACTDPDEIEKPLNDAADPVEFRPFLIEFNSQACGMAEFTRLEARAKRGLAFRSSYVVAQMLTSGSVYGDPNDSPNLPNAAHNITPGGGPSNLRNTVAGLLEDAMQCGVTGEAFIHAPAWTLPHWLNARLITQVGAVWKMGPHTVVLDQGFANEPTTGVADVADPDDAVQGDSAGEGQAWIYLSGPVEFALSSIEAIGDTTRGVTPLENRANVIAVQQGIYRFDPCCVFAALSEVS